MTKIIGLQQFTDQWGENARLALRTIDMEPDRHIPTSFLHIMDMAFLEKMTGHADGDFRKNPDAVYLAFQHQAGACMIDQYIPDNLLTMSDTGYEEGTEKHATTGAEDLVLDGIRIDSPEAVVEHMQRIEFPKIEKAIADTDPISLDAAAAIIDEEVKIQNIFGTNLLKVPYGNVQNFPGLRYYQYGYINYFMAYRMYPEVMERDFSLQADLAIKRNKIAANAYIMGNLPNLLRLDHDMADSRGTLVDVKSLDALWFPHFARSLQPYLDAGIRLIWHCDGNLMEMIPRLISCGVRGFQGFQYEDGMDYVKICRMKDRDGGDLLIWGGVSVTRTLPFGTPDDVKKEIEWLVANGPKRGLFLAGSSSVAPGVKHENLLALLEGLKYYREHGR